MLDPTQQAETTFKTLTDEWTRTLRRAARTVRISLQSNTEFCTGLLAARYGGGAEEWQRKEVA